MSEESEVSEKQLKEKVWRTVSNGALRGIKDTGMPIWALAQLWLLWEIYNKLSALETFVYRLAAQGAIR